MIEAGQWVSWKSPHHLPPEDGAYFLRISTPIGIFIRTGFWSSARQVWRDPENKVDFETLDNRLRIVAWFESIKT